MAWGPYDPSVSNRRKRIIGLAIMAVLLVWGALCARAVLTARKEAQAGLDALDHARDGLSSREILEGKGESALNAARAHFVKAHDEVSGGALWPVKWIPIVGRQVQSVAALSRGAEEVTRVGVDALHAANAIINASEHPKGPARVALIRRLGDVAATAKHDLASVGLGPNSLLLSPLKRAHDKFDTRLGEVRTTVSDLVDASLGMADFLQGPRRYLVIAANNSEARAGSGAYLSLGELTTRNGKFDLGEMKSANEVQPPKGAVPLSAASDPDFIARYRNYNPTADFRELALTGRLDVVAPLAAKMWKARSGHSVDGVLVLDPVALRALLSATGPVNVDGVAYSSDNVLPEVFVNQYRGLETSASNIAQIERRDKLSKIARAAIKKLDGGTWKTVDLFEALRKAGLGRHLLGWGATPASERGWLGAHIGGAFGPDSMLLSLQNRAGNKLDQFVTIDGDISTTQRKDGSSDVVAKLHITNAIPLPITKFPPYVIGPYIYNPSGEAGKYEGLLQVELPRQIRDESFAIGDAEVKKYGVAGPDGPDHYVLGMNIALKASQTITVSVRFNLPPGVKRSLLVSPTSRVLYPELQRAAVQWTFQNQHWTDEQGHRIRW